MKKLLLVLVVLATCGAQSPTLATICNTAPISWQNHYVMTEDLVLTAPVSCSQPVIIEGNGYTIVGGGLHLLPGAAWSTVRDVRFDGAGTGIALDIEAHGVRLQNLWVDDWGIGIRASSNEGAPAANANAQFWQALWVVNNDTGIKFDGIDANAGLLLGVQTRNNTTHILDSGFLGNTHVGGTMDGTGVKLKTDSAADYSTFIGSYIEGDPIALTDLSLAGYPLIVGGSLSKWTALWYGKWTVSPFGYSKLGFRANRIVGMPGDISVQLPGGPDSAMRISHLLEGGFWMAHKWISGWKSWLETSYAGGGTYSSKTTGLTHAAGPGHTVVSP